MTRWRCHAKINLYLRLVGPLPEGYHEIHTLFQEIDLADEISWIAGDTPLTFRVNGPVHCPEKDNLVIRAVNAFCAATGAFVGGRLTLSKRIPVGAGLGGGSSDAAAVLKGLNASFDYPLEPEMLKDIMAGLGSDVPFFLYGGTQIGRGRGDQLESVDTPEVPRRGCLLFPPILVSTARVYDQVGRDQPWLGRSAADQVEIGENDLLAPALACCPTLKRIFREIAPHFVNQRFFMTGSGSTFVWLTEQDSPIQGKMAQRLSELGVSWKTFSFVDAG